MRSGCDEVFLFQKPVRKNARIGEAIMPLLGSVEGSNTRLTRGQGRIAQFATKVDIGSNIKNSRLQAFPLF